MSQHDDDHEHNEIHDQGLQFDLQTLLHRRRALKLLSGAAVGGAAIALVGCGDDDDAAVTPAATGTTAASATAAGERSATVVVSPIATTASTPVSACTAPLPEETAGPFPGNGSNGPNVLNQSGIVRSDIRQSFGTSTNTAGGIPLVIELTVVDTTRNCAPMAGAAVYLWHCDREGRYSLYSAGATNENYCRGVQAADANGKLKFTTIFPAAYSGRWPHVHFEVYADLAAATASAPDLGTSQLALPKAACDAVYATAGYEQSVINLSKITLATDGVFKDGSALQLATTTGDVAAGYVAALTVGV